MGVSPPCRAEKSLRPALNGIVRATAFLGRIGIIWKVGEYSPLARRSNQRQKLQINPFGFYFETFRIAGNPRMLIYLSCSINIINIASGNL
jgi:hypothetical protein